MIFSSYIRIKLLRSCLYSWFPITFPHSLLNLNKTLMYWLLLHPTYQAPDCLHTGETNSVCGLPFTGPIHQMVQVTIPLSWITFSTGLQRSHSFSSYLSPCLLLFGLLCWFHLIFQIPKWWNAQTQSLPLFSPLCTITNKWSHQTWGFTFYGTNDSQMHGQQPWTSLLCIHRLFNITTWMWNEYFKLNISMAELLFYNLQNCSHFSKWQIHPFSCWSQKHWNHPCLSL